MMILTGHAGLMQRPGPTPYTLAERRRALRWKESSPSLPTLARSGGRYVDKDGRSDGPPLGFCLPREYAPWNLLPEVRDAAIEVFRELEIPWHAGVDGGPSNHLLSSQVQCVNALGQMMQDPLRAPCAFASLGVGRVLEIEPGRRLTFEYICEEDLLSEAVDGKRTRGAYSTSVDAALLHEHEEGFRELLLIEWKYTEAPTPVDLDPAKSAERWRRYGALLEDPAGPVRPGVLGWEEIQQEPFYQLVRQQLLACALERAGAHGVERVRVVHVSPAANTSYQDALTPAARLLGSSVSEVWAKLLRAPDRFVSVDSSVFLDLQVTSQEYCSRYGG